MDIHPNNTVVFMAVIALFLMVFTRSGRYATGASVMLAVGAAYMGTKLTLKALAGGCVGAYRAVGGKPLLAKAKTVTPISAEMVADMSDIKPASIIQRSLGKQAAVVFWFYDGQVKRSIRMHNAKLLKKYGRSVQLPSLTLESKDFSSRSKEELDEIIVRSVHDAVAFLDTDQNAALDKQHVIVRQEKPSTQKAETPKVEAQSEDDAAKLSQTSKPEVHAEHVGILEKFGMEKSFYGGKPTQRYAVLIKDVRQGGAPVELMGADLERAIREADVARGDVIKISHIGHAEVGKGKHPKKIYSIQKM